MLDKHDVIELLRYQVYRVEVRLLTYPYISYDEVETIGGVRIDTHKPSIDQALFDYVHTEESIYKGIFDRGYAVYYLQNRIGTIHEVDGQSLRELESIVDVDIKHIVYGVTDNGIYKIHKQY